MTKPIATRLARALGAAAALATAAAADPVSLIEMNANGRPLVEFRPIAGTPCYEKLRISDGAPLDRTLAPAGTPVSACAPPPPPPPGDAGDFNSEDLRSAPDPSGAFQYGLWHRDSFLVAEESWAVRPCVVGAPELTATRSEWMSSFVLCDTGTGNFLLRSAVGDTSGYSIGWFTPRQTFTRAAQPTVSWEVNLTNLGSRQWWEVIVIPAGDSTHYLPLQDQRGDGTDCKVCVTADWLAGVFGVNGYAPHDVVVGNGPFGGDVNITTGAAGRYDGWQSLHGDFGLLTPEQSNGSGLFRFQVTDNFDGTLTIDYGGLFTQTVPGSLPAQYEVVFKDHNYTPDKDGQGFNGHTWFWDKIRIQ